LFNFSIRVESLKYNIWQTTSFSLFMTVACKEKKKQV
jgi:hypothetical protein